MSDTAGTPAAADAAETRVRGPLRRVLVSSFVGSAIEWYDFILYGTVAALVFPALFFPNSSDTAATLQSLSTFAVGFIARPIGGIVAGWMGDRIGRKKALVMTLLTGGIATFLIGFVPTYETIGAAAPLLLVVLRLLQGFGVGGEWGSAVLMATEHSPVDRRGRSGGWAQLGVPAGLTLSTLVLLVTRASMSDQAFSDWGWRVPFWISAPLIVVGLFIRLKVGETPTFTEMARTGQRVRNPLWQVIRRQPGPILLTTGLRVSDNIGFFIPCTFAIAYAKKPLGYSNLSMEIALLVTGIGGLITVPLFARWSDTVGRRSLYLYGSLFCAVWAFPFFWLLDSKVPVLAIIAIFVFFNVGHSMLYGPQAAWFMELFDPDVRASGVNLGSQLSGVIAGGLTPLIATALVAASGGSSTLVAVYTAVTCLISVACAYWTRETLPSRAAGTVRATDRGARVV
ncbi:MAG: MHS family MFS transporter [Pseudonocardia sp.]|uniref:MFS transporter n=1 Tax=unclassified Pseudonocardia TaxID=2619320 RepID=UPI001ACB8A01|nr:MULTISPECIES: MFS transporter [unclassified Pseudonocardia]MBN9109032.1 MHS family MFS transporter [Pseudonocardia sp.]